MEKPQVLIRMNDGMMSEVIHNIPDLHVEIIDDYIDEGADYEPEDLINLRIEESIQEEEEFFLHLHDYKEYNPKRIEFINEQIRKHREDHNC